MLLSPSFVHTSIADAEEAPAGIVVANVQAGRNDTTSARDFSPQQLGVARQVARNEPALTAQLLSEWMARNG